MCSMGLMDNDEEAPDFGARLMAYREASGKSRAQVAAEVGVGENALRKIENGETKQPNFVNGVKISDAIGVTPHELAGLSNVSQATPSTTAATVRLEELERRVDGLNDQVRELVDRQKAASGGGVTLATEQATIRTRLATAEKDIQGLKRRGRGEN